MPVNPLISIIIPTFNRAHLIGETLDSIMAQTYENWECIIVDDGSTDDTLEVVANYIKKDGRFQYHLRPENRMAGGSAARNYGFELSKGELINWFDSDDLMDSDKLYSQTQLLMKNPKIDFVLCQTAFFTEKITQNEGVWNKNILGENPVDDFIVKKSGWSILAPLWRRSSIVASQLKFNEELKNSQDFKFHVEVLFKKLKPIVCNRILVFARVHNKQIKSHTNKAYSKVICFKFIYLKKTKLNRSTTKFVVNKLMNLIGKLYLEKNYSEAFFLSLFILKNEFSFAILIKILKFSLFGNLYLISGKGYKFLKLKEKY